MNSFKHHYEFLQAEYNRKALPRAGGCRKKVTPPKLRHITYTDFVKIEPQHMMNR